MYIIDQCQGIPLCWAISISIKKARKETKLESKKLITFTTLLCGTKMLVKRNRHISKNSSSRNYIFRHVSNTVKSSC
jgi:hypothetical protein